LIVVALLWAVMIVQWLAYLVGSEFSFARYGLAPRTLSGLLGIITMPLLHAGFWHLLGNTVPLLVLLAILVVTRSQPWKIVGALVLLGGALLWLFGRPAVHIGASGLICGLVTFLTIAGVLQRRIIPLAISIVVAFLYGGTVAWGVLPNTAAGTSWDGHLFGAIAGVIVAYVWTGRTALTPAPAGRAPG